MARLPRLIGRNRAMEVLLGSEDITGDLAQIHGYVNRALPDAELDALRRCPRHAHLVVSISGRSRTPNVAVNAASLAPEVEMAAGWEACIASVARPATQARFKVFRQMGWHQPGDAENRLGFYLGRVNQ